MSLIHVGDTSCNLLETTTTLLNRCTTQRDECQMEIWFHGQCHHSDKHKIKMAELNDLRRRRRRFVFFFIKASASCHWLDKTRDKTNLLRLLFFELFKKKEQQIIEFITCFIIASLLGIEGQKGRRNLLQPFLLSYRPLARAYSTKWGRKDDHADCCRLTVSFYFNPLLSLIPSSVRPKPLLRDLSAN